MSLDTRRTRHESACAVSTERPAHARRSRRRSVGTTTRSRLGARSAGVAGVGSDRAEPAMQRKRRGDVTRHTTHTTRECVCLCRRRDRRTHDEVGGARSTRRLARGSALARRASPVSALTEPSRRCNARGAVMSLDTRRTRHESACAVSTARPAHARRSRRRSVDTTTRSRLGARSAGVAGVGSDRAEPAMQRKRRGDVTRHTAHTTRERVCCVDGATGARTTKSAALGRHDDSLAARRSLGGRRRCRL